MPLSLVYGHPLAEKNCWRPLRTHAPFFSTVVARALTCSTMSRYERQSILQSPGSGNDFLLHSPISLLASLSSNVWTCYGRHQLPWAADMIARSLTASVYSLGLVWRRGGRWRLPADGWRSGRRDQPMSGRACCHGVAQQLLCCGQGLWSASGSGTVLCLGTKKTDPLSLGD